MPGRRFLSVKYLNGLESASACSCFILFSAKSVPMLQMPVHPAAASRSVPDYIHQSAVSRQQPVPAESAVPAPESARRFPMDAPQHLLWRVAPLPVRIPIDSAVHPAEDFDSGGTVGSNSFWFDWVSFWQTTVSFRVNCALHPDKHLSVQPASPSRPDETTAAADTPAPARHAATPPESMFGSK